MSVVLKFGGSSLKDPFSLSCIIDVILLEKRKKIVVFSAFFHVTRKLVLLSQKASSGDDTYSQILSDIYNQHIIFFERKKNLLEYNNYYNQFQNLYKTLTSIAENIFLLKKNDLSLDILDFIMSFGEKFSCIISCLYISEFSKVHYINSENIIKTDSNFGNANIKYDKTTILIQDLLVPLLSKDQIIVLPGFIASDDNNNITTIGWNGSDYTASIIASVIKAKELILYKDVRGVFDIDPNLSDKSTLIRYIDYMSMYKMSLFGSKIVHPNAIVTAMNANFTITIKSSFDSDDVGTIISNQDNVLEIESQYALTSLTNITLITINSIKYKNLLYDISEIFTKNNIKFPIFLQNINDISVTFAIEKQNSDKILSILEDKFHHDMASQILSIDILENKALLSIINLDNNQKKFYNIQKSALNIIDNYDIEMYCMLYNLNDNLITLCIDDHQCNILMLKLYNELSN